MKSMVRKQAEALGIGLFLLWVFSGQGFAHDAWIQMEDYSIEKGAVAAFVPVNGHHFVIPSEELLSRDQVEKAFFLDPQGVEVPVVTKGEAGYQSKTGVAGQGTFLAVLKPQGGLFSKTPEGYQRGKSRKDLTDVVECKFSDKYAKAVFTVGQPGGEAFSRVLGHAAEIVPLQDPGMLKKGEELRVKVLFDGKPARTWVYGTFAGFSAEANTFAYTTYTDVDGVAKIRLIEKGTWLLIVKQESAYPEASVCDKLVRGASLTFEIR